MYLDSAIIVKLLVREEDSPWFDRNVRDHELWSSELALAEVHSAILIKERKGLVSVAERKSAFSRFEEMHDTEVLQFHPLSSGVVRHAAGLLTICHPDVALRSLDAIHLATAMMHPRGAMCATDGKLRAAAKRMGVSCFPEEISEIVTD
ncbi:MAG: type II toxin-antitoxin system VapC family toxin [Verrucomicrobia bacterium]|nr:type II toxin-antitoxin system VapC family toxin [Verrucomicrobiota bacterium]